MIKLQVTPEGREGVYLVDKQPLTEWIKAKKFKTIHNFIPSGMMIIGADHEVKSVLEDIEKSERLAILTGRNANMGHELAIIRDNKLECYDIGNLTEKDLEVVAAPTDGGGAE